MPHVRISHHAFGQADAFTGSLDQGVRIFLEQLVVVRHVRQSNRVAFAFSAIAKAVKNDQGEWCLFVHGLSGVLIPGAASRTLHEIRDTAYRDHRNDEEKRNETHALFLYETAQVATFATTKLLRTRLRAPGKEMRADDEEEENQFLAGFQ